MTPVKFQIEPFPSTVLNPRSGVQSGHGTWFRDDHEEVELLDPALFAEVNKQCELGAQRMREQKPEAAQALFKAALRLLPEPLGRWNAAGWTLLALGHVCVVQSHWEIGRQVLTDAMWSPGVFGNPWAHRLKGEVHLALDEKDRAADDLLRAYKAAGHAVLEGTAPGCLALIEEKLQQAVASDGAT